MRTIERLEKRAYLASVGGGIVNIRDGLLRILGTDGPDTIFVMRTTEHGVDSYSVQMNSGQVAFAVSRVSRISIRGGLGDDDISIGSRIGGCYVEADVPPLDSGVHFFGGSDTIRGGGGRDTIVARNGNDLVFGGDGADIVRAGFGRQGVGQPFSMTVHGERGDDRLLGTGEIEIFGGDGADYIETGFNAAATVSGGEGNDSIMGGVCTYADAEASVSFEVNERMTAIGGRPGELDEIFTAIRIIGSPFDDRIDLVGHIVAIEIDGGPGNDTLRGHNELIGGEGNDHLLGANRQFSRVHPRLFGGPGADHLETDFVLDTAPAVSFQDATRPVTVSIDGTANDGQAGEGDNVLGPFTSIILGPADDTFELLEIGEPIRRVAVFGGDGDDHLRAGTFSHLFGQGGNDTLEGTGGRFSASGGGGRDLLLGTTGRDILYGGRGRDTLYGGDENDELSGNADADFIDGGKGRHDTLFGAAEEDTVINVP